MSDTQKGELIGRIIGALRFEADRPQRNFDAGDLFFSLAFKSDKELNQIAKLAGVI